MTAFRSGRRASRHGARSPTCGELRERVGATLCETSSLLAMVERRSGGRRDRWRDREGNFLPCKALKTHKTGKESRFCASTFHGPAERPAPRRTAQRAGGAARQNGVAGKWRRNGLKRLNPGPEMVWARKPRTHKIWYTGARLTVRRLRLTTQK